MKQLILASYNFIAAYMLPFLVSLTLSLIFTPIVRRFALKYKFASYPKQDRWRRRVVASLGGIAIFFAFLIPYLIFGDHDLVSIGFLFGSFGIFWLGIVDDVVHIKADTKLIGQIIVACIIMMFGIKFDFSLSPLVNIPLTILWIVGIINAFNLLDNMDGLCAGVAAISALILSIYSIMNNNMQLIALSLIVLGSALGFLKYNFNPAKIFMGDCGSMFLGYVLAVGALMGTVKEKSGLLVTMSIPALVLAVPIFDTIFVTLTRTINSRPISQGGKDHTSHRLVFLGLTERNAVLVLYGISAVCGGGALLHNKLNFLHMSIFLAILFVALVMFGIFLSSEVKVYSEEEFSSVKNKKKFNGKILFNGFIYNKRRIVEVILDFIIIAISYISAFILRFEGISFKLNIPLMLESLPIILIIKLLMFYFFGLYRGVWRYIGLYDVISIFKATFSGSILSIIALFFLFRFGHYSRTVFIIDWLITFISVSGIRILFRLYREFFANIRLTGKRILIFGAGDAGELTLREVRQNKALGYKAIGFVDDDKAKSDKIIHGVKVLGMGKDLEKLIYKYKIDEVLISIPYSNRRKITEICKVCDKINIPYREVSKIIQIKRIGGNYESDELDGEAKRGV
jgi:UDP-GlcNAc:undecaprenyl-phosphate/decaprenyl-phosphate GlcNAc-1-phosphate transferase